MEDDLGSKRRRIAAEAVVPQHQADGIHRELANRQGVEGNHGDGTRQGNSPATLVDAMDADDHDVVRGAVLEHRGQGLAQWQGHRDRAEAEVGERPQEVEGRVAPVGDTKDRR